MGFILAGLFFIHDGWVNQYEWISNKITVQVGQHEFNSVVRYCRVIKVVTNKQRRIKTHICEGWKR